MFNYDITIIIPVYNAENVIVETMNSLIDQTYSFEEIQILLINDGSKDNSEMICQEFERKYSNVQYIYKENSGVSDTRNRGIEVASGKYIIFLDSDDMLRKNTVATVLDFFERNQTEIDIVAYKLELYYETDEGIVIKEHPRNKNYGNKTGIYDVLDNPFLSQTTMNVCVKNSGDIIRFNSELPFCEDATFNTLNIMRKGKVGYVNECGYLYRQSNYSSVNKYESPVNAGELLLEYAERLFQEYIGGNIPKYVQSIVLYELRWRFQGKHLFPLHLNEDDLRVWKQRFKQIINKIDNDVIMNQPLLDKYHKFAFIRMKEKQIDMIQNEKGLYFYQDGYNFARETNFEVIITDIRVLDGQFKLMGFIKAALQEEVEMSIGVYENGKFKLLPLKPSAYSYHRKREFSNLFNAFEYVLPLNKVKAKENVEFAIKINDFYYPIKKEYLLRNRLFPMNAEINTVVVDDFIIKREKNMRFLFEKAHLQQINKLNIQNNEKIAKFNPRIIEYRQKMETKPIWLYNDRVNLADNAYLQFKSDFSKDNITDKYYVYDCELSEIIDRFSKQEQKNLVKFGSDKHKQLFVNAQYIYTAYQGFVEYSPFDIDEYHLLLDKLTFLLVYLQHGVLHCHAPWIYSREVTSIDKFIVSSNFEKENLTKHYLYNPEDVLLTGMSRFDSHSSKKVSTKNNKILFAPSWRSSVIKGKDGSKWVIDEDKLEKSEYFRGIVNLCESNNLISLLEKEDLKLDIQLHPIIKVAMHDYFEKISTERINFVKEADELDSYVLFVTDFSSFVFDAVYYNMPILYFVPDYDYFSCGNHSYSKLDLDIKDAFGEFNETVDGLVEGIQKIVDNDFNPLNKYKERMLKFYSYEGHPTQNIYEQFTKSTNYNLE